MNYISPVVLSIIGLWMAFWVFSANRSSRINQTLAILIAFSSIVVSLTELSSTLPNTQLALYLNRISYSFVALASIALYFFGLYFPKRDSNRYLLSFLISIVGFVFFIISIYSDLIIKGVEVKSGAVSLVYGSGIDFLYLALTLEVIIFLVLMIKKYFNITKIEKRKIAYFLVGLGFMLVANLIFNVFLPAFWGLDKYSIFADYSIFIFFGFTAYAIVKHSLFDVRLALVRSATYSLVLATLAGIYLAIALMISMVFNSSLTNPGQVVSGVAISLLLAFIFQPIKRFFDKATNRIFYKDNYSTDNFFAILNKTLSTTTDLRGLLERVAYEIGHTLKSEQAFFFINTTEGHYISAGTQHHKQLPKSDAEQIEKAHDGSHEIIMASLLESNNPTRRLMISHRIELILPLIKDGVVVGYLCLGDHLTSGYTNRDIKALNTISDELVIAIQNALAVHEIRELNSTLQQKVANATKELRSSNAVLRQLDKIKDEFISMASHQLRTPLTSVKGYISMVIEGDAGKITNSQKQLLNEAFISSERMVHLINDFLNVSRIQTGKFIIDRSSVDLSKLVGEEIDSLRPNATSRKLKFVYKPPKKFPLMELDDGKIRQVVMNYADNAIFYSHEDSTITVSLSIDKNEALFTVKDMGIGVPINEREHLFSKFYRASNARIQRPDGTGVGIYLAKKVIDAHGGKVVFESTEGKGSTFGFRLPLNQTNKI